MYIHWKRIKFAAKIGTLCILYFLDLILYALGS